MENTHKVLTTEDLPRIKGKLDVGLGQKQDTLVSGTNIKTINGEDILGPGNIETGAPSFSQSTVFQGEVGPVEDSNTFESSTTISLNGSYIITYKIGLAPIPEPLTTSISLVICLARKVAGGQYNYGEATYIIPQGYSSTLVTTIALNGFFTGQQNGLVYYISANQLGLSLWATPGSGKTQSTYIRLFKMI